MLRRFLSHWQNGLGLLLVAFYFFLAIAAASIAPPTDPAKPEEYKFVGRITNQILLPPNQQWLLGTGLLDPFGQIDIFYSVVWGSRSALQFGLTTACATAIFGTLIGAISGYLGGFVDSFTMRMTDAFLTIPVIAGVWLIQQVFFPPYPIYLEPPPIRALMEGLGLNPVMLGFILFSWMPYARLINANVARLKNVDFILASHSLGASKLRIIFKHVLPNTISPAVVLVARDVGGMVILEAAFTFIGLGLGNVWGQMLVSNRNRIIGVGGNPLMYWWTYLPPTLALIFFGIGWNLLGDGLNDALNPHHS
jgi:ABC-type dipeptide/oligopeptide/nickel transport system permease subunit